MKILWFQIGGIPLAAALAFAGGVDTTRQVAGALTEASCELSGHVEVWPRGGSLVYSKHSSFAAALAPQLRGLNPLPADRNSRGQQASAAWRTARVGHVGPRICGALESRIRAVRLNRLSFASDHAAARAGLLASGGTAPPPPLG